jgi:adenylate cyclase
MRANALPLPPRLVEAISVPADGSVDVLKKLLLLLGNLGGFTFSLILAVLYFLNDLPLPTMLAVGYLVAVGIVYLYFLRTRRFERTAFLFSLLLFLELVCQHIALGGFWASGIVLVWAAASALMAVISDQSRLAIFLMILFMVATGLFVLLEPVLAALGPAVPVGLSRLLFGLNFGFGLTYMILNSFYFMYLLGIARKQADDLLLNILPAAVAKRLKEGEETIADRYESASIMFIDIVKFTPLSAAATPVQVIGMLSELFSKFDGLVEKHHAEKIETVGDTYMIATGLPVPRKDHAQVAASLALDIQSYLRSGVFFNGKKIDCRIGINSGPLMAGVIGRKRISYHLWGDTVNTASRMESHGEPGQIQISKSTYELIKDGFVCEPRGTIEVKGKGQMKTFWLKGRAPSFP